MLFQEGLWLEVGRRDSWGEYKVESKVKMDFDQITISPFLAIYVLILRAQGLLWVLKSNGGNPLFYCKICSSFQQESFELPAILDNFQTFSLWCTEVTFLWARNTFLSGSSLLFGPQAHNWGWGSGESQVCFFKTMSQFIYWTFDLGHFLAEIHLKKSLWWLCQKWKSMRAFGISPCGGLRLLVAPHVKLHASDTGVLQQMASRGLMPRQPSTHLWAHIPLPFCTLTSWDIGSDSLHARMTADADTVLLATSALRDEGTVLLVAANIISDGSCVSTTNREQSRHSGAEARTTITGL